MNNDSLYSPIWDSLPINIMYQQHMRDNEKFDFWEKDLQSVKAGINFSIILNSAVMLEGYLEGKSMSILHQKLKKVRTEGKEYGIEKTLVAEAYVKNSEGLNMDSEGQNEKEDLYADVKKDLDTLQINYNKEEENIINATFRKYDKIFD